MHKLSLAALVLLTLVSSSVARAQAGPASPRAAPAAENTDYENWLIRVEDYETLHRSWWADAFLGDAEKQERVAELLLGPHRREAKAQPYEGIHFLFRAAVKGRRTAMLHLAEALDKGEFGLRKLPDAARCWASAPARFEQRLACVRLTDFSDPKARVNCTELAVMEEQEHPGTHDGADMARLCLANKTPALLNPGIPWGTLGDAGVHEYEQHGIEWAFTGDIYDGTFEKFRGKFNKTMAAGIESERGKGYLDRLWKEIEARVSKQHRKPK
jgi:hypothetical protein